MGGLFPRSIYAQNSPHSSDQRCSEEYITGSDTSCTESLMTDYAVAGGAIPLQQHIVQIPGNQSRS